MTTDRLINRIVRAEQSIEIDHGLVEHFTSTGEQEFADMAADRIRRRKAQILRTIDRLQACGYE